MANTPRATDGPQPAPPGSYGEAPRGHRLPARMRLGPVRLQVTDLRRSLSFYRDALGFRVLTLTDGRAALAAHGDDQLLVELSERSGGRPAPRTGRLGLFHFAILLPERAALGRLVRHFADSGVQAGAGDHLVSEALYLQDPDGLGIEIYADRPRGSWRRRGRELLLTTEPLDVADLVAAAGETRWSGMPAGTVIGHVHLHVGRLEEAAAYYSEALGFDRIVWSYPGALFLGAGGYHHHLGTNVWAGSRATPPESDEAQLLEWTIELPDARSVAAARRSLEESGYPADAAAEGEIASRDPWGTRVRLRAPAPIGGGA